uniref:protein-tyrosine-phosphatase n=2 Tax=Spongospora subterranea TaxID=70186 RepID=A0A0H5RSD7_9EUKA|eukprot:CRZ11654.1 hypothetical protein [Spongospora subterranea]
MRPPSPAVNPQSVERERYLEHWLLCCVLHRLPLGRDETLKGLPTAFTTCSTPRFRSDIPDICLDSKIGRYTQVPPLSQTIDKLESDRQRPVDFMVNSRDRRSMGSPIDLPRKSLLSSVNLTPTPPRKFADSPLRRIWHSYKPDISQDNNKCDDKGSACPLALAAGYYAPILPVMSMSSPPVISCDTVMALLSGRFSDIVNEYLIVDCRYDYEHDGGHIPNAISINHQENLSKFHEELRRRSSKNLVIIFHCEFSQNRAPKTFRAFRSLDRAANTYPTLSFPQMYIMKGGYRQFFNQYQSSCKPQSYVTMADPTLSKQWRKEVKECRKSWTKRKGHHAPDLDQVKVLPSPKSALTTRRFLF